MSGYAQWRFDAWAVAGGRQLGEDGGGLGGLVIILERVLVLVEDVGLLPTIQIILGRDPSHTLFRLFEILLISDSALLGIRAVQVID